MRYARSVHTIRYVHYIRYLRRLVSQAVYSKNYSADALASSSIVAKMTSKGRRFGSSSRLTARKQAYTVWRRMADALSLNTDFAREVASQLHVKRLNEAKYRLLERLKAQMWALFEDGIIGPQVTDVTDVTDVMDVTGGTDVTDVGPSLRTWITSSIM